MRISGFGRHALTCCVAAAMLAGCGGSQPPIGAPGALATMPKAGELRAQGRTHRASGSSSLYLYLTGSGGVKVLTYPEGIAIRSFEGSEFICTDPNSGNVYFVQEDPMELVEYTPGGASRVGGRGLPEEGYIWGGCAVDRITGTVAIAADKKNNHGQEAAVLLLDRSGRTRVYTDPDADYFSFCGYDDKGNLFLDGLAFDELRRRGHSLTRINFKDGFVAEGTVQWDGTYITLDGDGRFPVIYRITVSGSSGTVVGKTKLGVFKHPNGGLTWIEGNVVMAPWNRSGHRDRQLGFWSYPEGGREPYRTIRHLQYVNNVTTGITGTAP